MRAAYLGPPGTNSHEALVVGGLDAELVAQPTVGAVVATVQAGEADRGLLPIENSREGSVAATLDALVFDGPDLVIVGELVHRVSYCLAAAEAIEPDEVRTVHSHPQATGQCARFLAAQLPGAAVVAAASTADAVRAVSEGGVLAGSAPHAAIGTRHAAGLYGATVLAEGIEDDPENATRFAWIARADAVAASSAASGASSPGARPVPAPADDRPSAAPGALSPGARSPSAPGALSPGARSPSAPGALSPGARSPSAPGALSPGARSPSAPGPQWPPGPGAPSSPRFKTALVFWGGGDLAPGWLVDCLAEFASRAINLTRIESRPRRIGLGHYMFICDLEGAVADADVAAAIAGLRAHCETVRVLGSFPAAR